MQQVYNHVYNQVYNHVYNHVYNQVYYHVYNQVYNHAYNHVYKYMPIARRGFRIKIILLFIINSVNMILVDIIIWIITQIYIY